MESKRREQIAIALFTGSIISLFFLIESLVRNFNLGLPTLLILIIGFIFLSLKIMLEPSADLHHIGNIIRRLLNIRY